VAPVVLDIAMTLIGCCFDASSAKLKPELAVSFLDAYNAVRPLPDNEWQALSHFVDYALIATAFWRFRYVFKPKCLLSASVNSWLMLLNTR
jgi:Ser/Thr protein kinase RdoA (MazF antagonist)